MGEKPKLIAVVGTNASGKSGLGVALARKFGGEIVSADSRQVYRRMDLGSGKIEPEEMLGVRHHLIDIREPGEFFSMADYQREAYAAIDGILARGNVPFLVGGTGLYVEAVTEGYALSDTPPDLEYREYLETFETERLYAMLLAIDPETDVDPKNRNRVMRILEKRHDGDAGHGARDPKYDTLKLGVTWDRQTLAERIERRYDARMRAGMADEVRGLLDGGVSEEFLMKLGLEYRFLTRYIRGELDENALREQLLQAIRKFAKRQMTWFKRDGSILWLDMRGDPVAEATVAIERFLEE